jgi:hypothetical protein
LELAFQVVVSRYGGLTYDGSRNGANEIVTGECVGASGGDEHGAGKALAMEFVDEEAFEGVGNGVDPADPFEPWMHQRTRNWCRLAGSSQGGA